MFIIGKLARFTVSLVKFNICYGKIIVNDVEYQGFMHVSQYSNEYIKSLTDAINVGDIINVVVCLEDEVNGVWEVSKLGYDKIQSCVLDGYYNVKLQFEVVNCGERGIILSRNDIVARISKNETEILKEYVTITNDSIINAVICDYDILSKSLKASVLKLSNLYIDEEIQAKILSISKISSNKLRLKWQVVGEYDGTLFSIDTEGVFRPDLAFEINKVVKIKPYDKKIGKFRRATFISESPMTPISIGDEIETYVQNALNYGAFCLIRNNISGMIHHKDIQNTPNPNIDDILTSGDLIKCKVISISDDNKYALSFISMVKSDIERKCTMFDLTSQKKGATTGGFHRDPRFRKEVIALFNNICAVCGDDYSINNEITSCEAAHIVPRSMRGVDDLSNGLCLCKIHHWAFDEGLISIDPDSLEVNVSKRCHSESFLASAIRALNGRRIYLPVNLNIPKSHFEWHYKNVFE